MEKRIRLSSEKAFIKKAEPDQNYYLCFNLILKMGEKLKNLENDEMDEPRPGLCDHL
jgi:hypothetical protein